MKIVILVFIVLLIAGFFIFDLGDYLTLSYIKSKQEHFAAFYTDNAFLVISIYAAVYVVVTALSLPGAAVMTLMAGALFGTLTGTIIVSFASTIGATLAFLFSRYLFKDLIQNKYGDKLKTINDGMEKEGLFYLFTLRLIPLIPFFVINLVMGITPVKTIQFYIVSQIGMLAGTIVFVYAGTQLGQINSLSGILSPNLIAAFVLLGVFPLLAKRIIEFTKKRKNV